MRVLRSRKITDISGWATGALSSLRFRDFRLLWLGQLANSMGMWMDTVTQGWLMYELTGSPVMLGLTGAFKGVSLLTFGVIAGVTADRYGKKLQLLVSQLMNGATNVMLVVLVVTHLVQPWHILVAAALNGMAQAFQQPARQAMISDLVAGSHLTNAIALNSAAYNFSRLVGPTIAGFAVALAGITQAYLLQLVTYIFAAMFTVLLSVPLFSSRADRTEEPRTSILQDTRAGLAYIKSDKVILALIMLALVSSALGMPYINLMPIFAKDILKVGPEGLGILLGASGVGSLFGALLFAGNPGRGKGGKFLIFQSVIFGIVLAAFSFSPWVALSIPLLVVVGLTGTGANIFNNTLIQTHTPASLRARVLAIFLLNAGMVAMGTMLAGAMAGFMGAPLALGILGGACAAFAIYLAVAVPRMRRLA